MKMPAERIREEIVNNGAISFARFMELALYCPETGYYERKKDNVGRAGDFITSVSVGSLFGELLGFQFARWLDELKTRSKTLRIIEAGAHDGKLAADILAWLQDRRPDLFSHIEYCVIDPSPQRQQWQRKTLKPFPNVRWAGDFDELAHLTQEAAHTGISFSNELLDALPVHRLGWDAAQKSWFEWGVTLADGHFAWVQLAVAATPARGTANAGTGVTLPPAILNLPPSLLAVLPDHYTIEISPAAEKWWRSAAGALAHGRLLAVDYGFGEGDMFLPGRMRGTVRAYYCHQVSDDLLANPGEQDLTAHVDFFALQRVGEDRGLHTETFCTQPQFLTRILGEAVRNDSLGDWDARRTRQFQTLTHPEHLGRAFRVLVQTR